MVHPQTERIHTSYNQTVTATGRLSSSNPNLQNIPIRTLEGRRIRQAFIAPKGYMLVSADYSQIELRVLAHLSGDEALIEVFEAGEDIHTRTASDIFGVFPEMVSPEMRRQAKVINFGVIYGMSAFGLAKELGIAQAEAGIHRQLLRQLQGRPEIPGRDSRERPQGQVCQHAAEPAAVHPRDRQLQCGHPPVRRADRHQRPHPGHGGRSHQGRHDQPAQPPGEAPLACRMIMQVHDELVFEVPEAEKDDIMALVKREMEGVVKLRVPLKVEIAAGKNWDEAH